MDHVKTWMSLLYVMYSTKQIQVMVNKNTWGVITCSWNFSRLSDGLNFHCIFFVKKKLVFVCSFVFSFRLSFLSGFLYFFLFCKKENRKIKEQQSVCFRFFFVFLFPFFPFSIFYYFSFFSFCHFFFSFSEKIHVLIFLPKFKTCSVKLSIASMWSPPHKINELLKIAETWKTRPTRDPFLTSHFLAVKESKGKKKN